jgi:endonuclease/exonuclease/phosphatase family metal-dependent hydrolase
LLSQTGTIGQWKCRYFDTNEVSQTLPVRPARSLVTRLRSVIAYFNYEHGGIDPDGTTARWERTIAALAAWAPDIVCVQEMAARRDPHQLRRHLWATANALAMTPVLGPEGGNSGNHTAILVNTATAVITDDGPPPGTPDPAWCEVLLRITAAQADLRVYSTHLPPGSAADQLRHAEQLAARIAQRGELAIAAGDWNCWAAADPITPQALAGMPLHLRPARMQLTGGQLTARYDVHHTLTTAGLTDAAAALEPLRRDPPQLTPTGINGGARVDRFYVTSQLWDSGAIQSYTQRHGGGSDHEFAMLTLSSGALGRAQPPGFRDPGRGHHRDQLHGRGQVGRA